MKALTIWHCVACGYTAQPQEGHDFKECCTERNVVYAWVQDIDWQRFPSLASLALLPESADANARDRSVSPPPD